MTIDDKVRTAAGGDYATTPAAKGVQEEVKGAARDVLDEARAAGNGLKKEASGLAGTLKDGLAAQAEQQKNAIAERIGRVADRVQTAASDLRGEEAWLAGWMERGAKELGGLADDIHRNDVAGLVGSAEVFARRQPAVFIGAAVAVGFALTRLLKGGDRETTGAEPYRPAAPMPSTPANWQDVRRPPTPLDTGSVGQGGSTFGRDYAGIGPDDRRGAG